MSSYSDYADSVSRILTNKGDALAQGQANSASIWGNTISTLGQQVPLQVQQAIEKRAKVQRTEQIQRIFQEAGGDLEKAIPEVMKIDTELGSKLLEQHTTIKKHALELKNIEWEGQKRKFDWADRMLGQVHDEDSYATYVLAKREAGDKTPVPPQYDPEWVKQQKLSHLTLKEQLELEKPKDLVPIPGPDGKPIYGKPTAGAPVYERPPASDAALVPIPGPDGKPVYGKPTAGAPVYEKEGAAGSGSDYAQFLDKFASDKGKRRSDLTSAEELQARKLFGQADDRPATTIRLDSGMTPGQEFSATMQLSSAYQREVASAKTVAQQLALMRASMAAVKKGDMTAGSQGVLVTFQKILDPTSVVRESEYARSASGLSLMSRLQGSWTKISEGGAGVTPADLEQFLTLAEQFNRQQQSFAAQTRARIDATAKKYKLDPSLVSSDVDAPLDTPAAPAAPAAAPKKNPFR